VPLISINVETVAVPEAIIRELRNRGIDAESLMVELLVRVLNLDPKTTAQAHVELALSFLRRVGALLIRILFRPVRSFTRLPRNQLRRLQVA